MGRTWKARLRLVGLTLALVVLSTAAVAQAAASTTVTVWSWRIEDVPAYEEMFRVFEERNPEIRVEFVAYQDSQYETILTTALRGNRGPDIAQLKPYGELQSLIRAGYLKPLDGIVPELNDFYPDALEGARSVDDGKIYGVPYAYPNMGIFYNTAIFEKYGLEVPTTWAEFLEVCETLKAAGVTPIAAGGASGSGWALEILIGVFGPNVYGANEYWNDITTGKANFEDPRFIATLRRLQELRPYLTPGFEGIDYTSATFQFMNGQAAMFIGGSWENGSFKIQAPDLEFSVFPAPPDEPGQPAYTSSFADGSYGLVAGSEDEEAALKVLRFMASREFCQMFADKLGWPPAMPGIESTDPALTEMLEMQRYTTPYLTLVGFRWEAPTGSELVQTNITGMLVGRITPEEMARRIQAGVASWYEPFGGR